MINQLFSSVLNFLNDVLFAGPTERTTGLALPERCRLYGQKLTGENRMRQLGCTPKLNSHDKKGRVTCDRIIQ